MKSKLLVVLCATLLASCAQPAGEESKPAPIYPQAEKIGEVDGWVDIYIFNDREMDNTCYVTRYPGQASSISCVPLQKGE